MVYVSAEVRARAELERRKRRRAAMGSSGPVDPVARLMDPTFDQRLWDYPESFVGPELPGNLHHKQREALEHPALHRWLFWANQAGKTTLGAVDVVLTALGRHPLQRAGLVPMPPITAWASALSWELWEKILLPELLTWLPPDRVEDAPPAFAKSTKRDIVVTADNGEVSRITGKAAEQGASKYQAARIHLVWLDEEHPEEVWNEMQPRLARFCGRSLATMTPLKGETTYVFQRIYVRVRDGKIPPERHWYSHAGVADNPGISAAAVAELEEEFALTPSQLPARLYGLFVKPVGIVYQFDIRKHGQPLSEEQVHALLARGQVYGGFDLGKWRWFFFFGVKDTDGTFLVVDEVFSQNETADVRARRVHDCLTKWGVTDITIMGECADPEELREINEALERIESPFRFYPVDGALKLKSQGITRVDSLLNRGALLVRRDLGLGYTWRLGRGASSNGTPMEGSRLIWEFNAWRYPEAPDGKVQKDEPDDASADGADAMDGLRYLMMFIFGAVVEEPVKEARTRVQEIWAEVDAAIAEKEEEDVYGHVLRQG